MDKLFSMGKSLFGGKKSSKGSNGDSAGTSGGTGVDLLDNMNPMAMFQSLDKNGDGKSKI